MLVDKKENKIKKEQIQPVTEVAAPEVSANSASSSTVVTKKALALVSAPESKSTLKLLEPGLRELVTKNEGLCAILANEIRNIVSTLPFYHKYPQLAALMSTFTVKRYYLAASGGNADTSQESTDVVFKSDGKDISLHYYCDDNWSYAEGKTRLVWFESGEEGDEFDYFSTMEDETSVKDLQNYKIRITTLLAVLKLSNLSFDEATDFMIAALSPFAHNQLRKDNTYHGFKNLLTLPYVESAKKMKIGNCEEASIGFRK